MPSSIVPNALPSGGVVTLKIASTPTMVLSRAVSGTTGLGAFTQLYSGGTQPFYIDVGDQLPGPLDPTSLYVYQLSDDNGVIQSAPVAAAATLAVQIEPLTFLLQRTIQGAVNSLVLPPGINRTQVLQAMPIAGIPAMPFITLNQNLLQQKDTPIGQSFWVPDFLGNITVSGMVNRLYQISILSTNGPERDFYRDAMVGIFQMFVGGILSPIGRDVTHQFQINSGQVAQDNLGKAPGFYYADCMLEFSGNLDVTISTNYGVIERIDFTAYTPDQTVIMVDLPLS